MKNKKLFAILTLVCFMFTLMPVAAFAAVDTSAFDSNVNSAVSKKDFGSVKTGFNYVDTASDVTKVNITTAGAFYIYAVDNATGKLAELEAGAGQTQVGDTVLVNATTTAAVDVKFAEPGAYTLFAATYVNATQCAIIANENWAYTNDEVLSFLNDFVELTMYNNVVTVGAADVTYVVTLVDIDGTPVSADNGYSSTRVMATVKDSNGYAIPNVEVNLYTDSYGLTVTPLTKVTNAAGQVVAKVTGSVPGNFNVYAQYEDSNIPSVGITVSAIGEKEVAVVAEPVAPVDVNTTVGASGIAFKITDGFGNDALNASPQNYKVTLLAAPANFARTDTYTLTPHATIADAYVLDAATTDAMKYEGTYTFQVSLQNGASATASVEVKKFDKPVAIQFVKAPTTMAYTTSGSVLGYGVYEVDANGVTRNLTPAVGTWNGGLTISANGKAIQNFTFNAGLKQAVLDPINDDDYIGSVVTVMAVYTNGQKTFTATNNITIVDTAATIAYKDTTAEVGVNNILEAKIVDSTGALTPVTTTSTVQVIVLDKPENAVVTVNPTSPIAVAGSVTEFDVNFLASAAGEYKIQTIVVTNDNKYISGIETITVGGGEGAFQDVIVMSIGANQLVKNSKVVEMPAAPEIVDSRTMVPARAGLEAFGATVVWDEATQTVTAELNGVKVVMTIGEKAYTVNGKAVVGDAAPYISTASTMVPVSFFTNAFGIVATPIYDANGVCDVLFTK